ncbi:MAG: RidA family protein [Anaerolineaceae bacterium]|nr:RidA family protein [Anaerolineaceae bacterium]
MKTFRNPNTVHPPLAAYAHQVEISGPQRWLILSGQVGITKDGTLPADPIDQVKTALANIKHNLEEADMEIRDLVKLTTYLVGEFDPKERREVVSFWLDGHSPCMTLIYVASLASPDIKVEIEATACVDDI